MTLKPFMVVGGGNSLTEPSIGENRRMARRRKQREEARRRKKQLKAQQEGKTS